MTSVHFSPLPSHDIDAELGEVQERKHVASTTVPLTLEEALAALAEARQQIRALELRNNFAETREAARTSPGRSSSSRTGGGGSGSRQGLGSGSSEKRPGTALLLGPSALPLSDADADANEHFAITADEDDGIGVSASGGPMVPLEIADSSGDGSGADGAGEESGHVHPPHGSLEDEYWKLSIWQILGRRLPWLVGLLLLQSFSAAILHSMEDLIQKHIVLAAFVPLLVGTGGNAGNQPGVNLTRALALGQVDVRRLVARESVLAFFTAAILAVVSFFRIWLEYPEEFTSAMAISSALFCVIILSVYLGLAFSYCLENIRSCDPADGAAPLLATVSDLIGIALLAFISFIYFGKN